MAYYYGNGCNTLGGFPCSDCPPKELGRVRSLAFIPTTYTFINISSTSEWFNNIINPVVGYIIPYTNGSYAMAPKESNSFGNYDKEVDSYENTLECMEINTPTISGAWWNTLSLNKGYQVAWRTSSAIYISGIGVQVIPKFKIDDDIQSRVLMGVTVKWISSLVPIGYSLPTGIFDNCAESNFN